MACRVLYLTVILILFLSGAVGDDQFLAACMVERASDAKKRDFQPFGMDVVGGGLARTGEHGTVDRKNVDVKDEDLTGVQDQ